MSLKKIFNLMAFTILTTTLLMNNVQAKEGSEQEEAKPTTIVLDKNDDRVKEYEADKLLFMQSEDKGTTLLFSDSPETVPDDGVLYEDTVKGDTRLLYYHVNGTEQDKKIAVVLRNMSDKPNKVTITREAVAGPSADYLYVGKVTMQRYFGEQKTREITLRPHGRALLRPEDGQRIIPSGDLVYGIFDFHAEQNLKTTVVLAPSNADLYDYARYVPVLSKDKQLLRGTFRKADRYLTNRIPYDTKRKENAYFYIGDNKTDLYRYGTDRTDRLRAHNFGNYGINYHIHLDVEGEGKTSYYLKPMGGVYAGAMTVQVGKDGEKKLISTPDSMPFFGHDKNLNYYAYLGTYDNSDDVYFEYTPPGASNLPVQMILVPEK
ncbi:hypothetical protein [Megamonas hypermegale]|nr:hypothetical protein [Megamonas hypermegale]